MPPGRWSLAHEADRFHLVAASGDRALGEERATAAPDAPVVLTIEGTHGPIIHAVTEPRRARRAAGARLTDARALDPALLAVPADPDGDAALLAAARALGGALVAAGRGRRRMGCGSTSAESRICSAASRAGARHASAVSRGSGFTARVAIAPTAAAAWALARSHPPLRERATRAAARGEARASLRCPCLPRCAAPAPPETVRTLERLGLKTIGALIGLAAARAGPAVPRGRNVVDALDRLIGASTSRYRRARRSAAARAAQARRAATHRSAQALERLIPSWSRKLRSGISARGGCRSAVFGSTAASPRVGRDRDRQPRAEAPAAPARRQSGELDPNLASMPSR